MDPSKQTSTTTTKLRSSSRVPIPTQAAKSEQQRKLKLARSTACGKVTGKTNEIKALHPSATTKDTIETLESKIKEWDQTLANLTTAHKAYVATLTEEELHDDIETWAAPIFNGFDAARKEMERRVWQLGQQDESIEPSDSISQVSSPSSKKYLSDRRSSCRSHTSLVPDVKSSDGASRVSLSSSKVSRSNSRASSRSSISLARADAAAKKAELLARAAALKKKQALDEKSLKLKQQRREQEMKRKEEQIRLERQQEEDEMKRQEEEDCLRCEQEQLEVETEIAVADARLRAFDQDEVSDLVGKMEVDDHPEKSFLRPSINPYATEFNYNTKLDAQQSVTSTWQAPTHQSKVPIWMPPEPQSAVAGHHQTTSDALEIMKQHDSLTKLLIEAQIKSSLPQRAIPVFNGDPLEYMTWLSLFTHGVEDRCTSSKDRLFYLEQFTGGEVNRLVRSFMKKEPEAAYKEAKEMIAARYGNKYKLSDAFMSRAEKLAEVKSEDVAALNSMSLFLIECQNLMLEPSYMDVLNHPRHIQMLVAKLPYKLRERWRTVTDTIQEEKKQAVTFDDLVKFVTKQARIAANPVYGNIRDAKDAEKSKPVPRATIRRRAFASAVERKDELTTTKGNSCMFCHKDNHALDSCYKLKNQPIKERLSYLKKFGLCFGCLKRATHIRKDCTNKLTCTVCKRHHPTVLHEDQSPKHPLRQADSANSKTTCGLTGAGTSGCLPAIIPVQVRAKDSGMVIKTYAFLDDGSNAVFCTLDLQRKLRTKGKTTHLTVETINQTKVTNSNRLMNLEVLDVHGDNVIPLPEVFTQTGIPASKDDVLTQENLKKWPYLHEVIIPAIEATEVGLLIGNNVPKAMEPLQVINSQGDGPFACRTSLGWVVHGVPNANSQRNVSVNRVIVHEQMDHDLINLYNHEFSERLPDDNPQRSKEDQRFLNMVSSTTSHLNKHYEIGLPLRTKVSLPNNRPLAEQRTAHLKRKLQRGEDFRNEYHAFMNDMLDKGYAEVVPEAERERSDGKVWYIPHHGVMHPQKNKLRVVFDCAASYKGRSLNNELLQGPDLTSSLVGVLLRFREHPVALMADVEAMYYQVRVPKSDRDLLRFLWWPDGDINMPLQEYRMNVHVFGATSSPACANFALRQTAEDGQNRYSQEVCDTIRSNFYVDDCLKSIADESEAIQHAHELTKLCSEGGFRLTKWMSNKRNVLESIPLTERAKEVKS
ncbi:uncharacterized protein [Amphiura filiformis]|uniref:uncharacterized protein n=1 Tax=Amphiura filiformis TaxID=82378 RepID=UPI003B228CE1